MLIVCREICTNHAGKYLFGDNTFSVVPNAIKAIMGIDDDLKQMGIENGDTIRILDYEFEYRD